MGCVYLENAKWKNITLTFKLCHSFICCSHKFRDSSKINLIPSIAVMVEKITSAPSHHQNNETLYYHLYCLCLCLSLCIWQKWEPKKRICSLGNVELLASSANNCTTCTTWMSQLNWCSRWSAVNEQQPSHKKPYTMKMKMKMFVFAFVYNLFFLRSNWKLKVIKSRGILGKNWISYAIFWFRNISCKMLILSKP